MFRSLLLSVALIASGSVAQTAPINFATMTLNGSTRRDGSDIVLTTSNPNQAGSAFISIPTGINSSTSFSAAFEFSITNPQNDFLTNPNAGGDGLTFVVHNDAAGATALGTVGGGLGYGGINSSVAVEFDTWDGGRDVDPNDNHVGINTNGSMASLVTSDPGVTLETASSAFAWVDYDGSILDVFFNTTNAKPGSALLSSAFDLTNIGDSAFFGFTAATGSATAEHRIKSFQLEKETKSKPAPVSPAPVFSFPMIGLDQIFVNTVSGGKCAENIQAGCTDVFHTESKAYYSVDFDLNGNSDAADVIAAANGKVVATGGNGKCTSNNNCIVIDHGDGYYTEYRELTSLNRLSVGDEVELGEKLGTVVAGKSQNDSGNPDHLHFQILYDQTQSGNHLNAKSSINVKELEDVKVGGVRLSNFALAPNGNQGVVGLIAAAGDISEDVTGVTGYERVSSLTVGRSAPGKLIVNGTTALDIDTELSIGSSGYGEMFVANGATVKSENIIVGDQSGGQGYINVSGKGTLVDGGSFVGFGLSMPASPIDGGGVAIGEILNSATLKAETVGVGVGGTLRQSKGGTIEGNVIVSGGTLVPRSSPGIGYINGDLSLLSGRLELEREGSLTDQLFVSGSIFVGSEFQIDWFGDFFDGEVISISDYLIGDYMNSLTPSDILFQDVSSTALSMRLFTSNINSIGNRVTFDLGGYSTTLNSTYMGPDVPPVPVPASILLLASGLFGLGCVPKAYRRSRRSAQL